MKNIIACRLMLFVNDFPDVIKIVLKLFADRMQKITKQQINVTFSKVIFLKVDPGQTNGSSNFMLTNVVLCIMEEPMTITVIK